MTPGSIDPTTMNNFWLALIGLISAITAILQQWNASRGKARGEETKQAIQQHNDSASAKLDTIQQTVNGKLENLQKENADLKAQLAVQQNQGGIAK